MHLSPVPVVKHVWFAAPCRSKYLSSLVLQTHFVVPGLRTSSVFSTLPQTRLILVSYL